MAADQWDEKLDGVWDESRATEIEVAGRTIKAIKGCYKQATRPGRYTVEEYIDAKSKEVRTEQDSETPFAAEALAHAREACNMFFQEAKAARDAAAVQSPKSLELSDVVALLQAGGQLAERVPGHGAEGASAATAEPTAPDEEDDGLSDEEEDHGLSSTSRLAAQFGAPKAKAAAVAKAAKAQPKAAKAKATPPSSAPVQKEPQLAVAAGRERDGSKSVPAAASPA